MTLHQTTQGKRARRVLALAAGGTSCLLAVAGCGGSGANASAGGKNATVTIWATTGTGPTGAGPGPAGWKAVTSAFEKQHPNITIGWKNYSAKQDPSSYQTLLTAVAGGNGPDVAMIDRFLTTEFSVKGAIQPITPYLTDKSLVLKETKLIPGAYPEQHVGNKFYGLTFPFQSVGFWSLCYNKSMFKAANLTPPKTWAQVVTDTQKLTKTKGNRYTQLGYEPYPLNDATNDFFSEPHVIPLVSDGGWKANLTNPDAVKAVTHFVNVMNAEGGYAKVSKFANPSSTLPSQDPFYTGRAAMDDCGDWYLQTIAQYYPKLPVGVVPLPSPDGSKPWGWAGGWSMQIVKGAKHPRQAAQFLQYMMTKKANQEYYGAWTAYNAKHHLPNVIIGPETFIYPGIAKHDMASLPKQAPDLYSSVQHFLNVPRTYAGVNYRPHTVAAGELFTDYNNAAIAAALHEGSPMKELKAQGKLVQQAMNAQKP